MAKSTKETKPKEKKEKRVKGTTAPSPYILFCKVERPIIAGILVFA